MCLSDCNETSPSPPPPTPESNFSEIETLQGQLNVVSNDLVAVESRYDVLNQRVGNIEEQSAAAYQEHSNLIQALTEEQASISFKLNGALTDIDSLFATDTELQTQIHQIVSARNQEAEEREAERLRQAELARKSQVFVTTNMNAIAVEMEYENGERDIQYYFAKQDRPENEYAESDAIPIKADVFYAKNDLVENGVQDVTIEGSAKVQAPSMKRLNKADASGESMKVELIHPRSVTVYFGFFNNAGIAEYDIYEIADPSRYFVKNGEVDLHSSSDTIVPTLRGVELVDGLNPVKNYILEIRHSTRVNAGADALQANPIYIGDVVVHRLADATNSVVEFVSNDAFANNSYIDNGSQNSITGRKNFVEFFDTQVDVADGSTYRFNIDASVLHVRSVEIDNGRGFKRLDKFIDWEIERTTNDGLAVVMKFIPKMNAKIRIKYDTHSSRLQRKLELTQPIAINNRLYDRYMDLYVQNEAAYIEVRAQTSEI